MQKIILMLLLAGLSNNVMADMVEIGNGLDGDKIFVDPTTVHRTGNSVTMWGQFNYSKPQNLTGRSPYLSKVTQVQFDCKSKEMRSLYTNYYSEINGKGNKVFFENSATILIWKPIVKGTGYEKLFKYDCDKK